MAGPGRHGAHARGRHAAVEPPAGRRAAPVAAFLAVVLVAALTAWVVGQGGGGHPAGPASDNRAALTAGPSSAQAPGDRASRDDDRSVPAPALSPIATGGTRATPSPAPAPPTTTTSSPSSPSSPRPGRTPTAPPPTSSAPTSPPTSSAPAPTPADYAAEVTRLTNAERAKVGCGALRVDSRLAAAAQAHSKDMADRNYFSHTSPDGDGPGERAAAAGYPKWSGENIAAAYPTPEAVVQGWMASPDHEANILNCDSEATGVGYDPRGDLWTQMFGYV